MKLKFFFFLLLSLYIVNCTFYIEAQATIRYVSKTGTSTPPYTSWETAADSIQKCINICFTGDTIYVANGIYKENLVINTAISLIGSSMDSTVIDGTGLALRTIDFVDDGSILNITILGQGNNPSARGIYARRYLIVENCKIQNTGLGIGILNSASIVKNCILNNIFRGYDSGCYSGNCSDSYIENSVFIMDKANTTAIRLDIGNNYLLKNNLILFVSNVSSECGISIGAPNRVLLSNNLISGFRESIFIDNPSDTLIINNNLLAYSDWGILCAGDIVKTFNDMILNNIKGIESDIYLTTNYNLYWKNEINLKGVGTTPVFGDSDIVADPMFVNDTIPIANGSLPAGQAGYDFHLQKYSPAIDKGDPTILDVDGSRSDIGMFGGPLGESYTYQDLAPKPPANLTATMDSGLVHLKWNRNTEADLFRYRVYRDTVPDFIYDTTKIVAVLSDTSFYDDPPQKFISGNYYYKITAIDSAYNQSPASEEVHINITGIPEAPPIVVEHYNLLQNYPNPFNPGTTIPYRLKAPGYVKVMVYNLLGELVRVLVNQYQSAGYYEVLFHPTATERKSAEGKIEFETGYGDIVSGIYLYRIEVIGEGNIPVFTDMKKMMLVK